jgi:hypothetical protein
LFQGYVQGYCETYQFLKSLPHQGQSPTIVWLYARPTLGEEYQADIMTLAKQELARLADVSALDFHALQARGQCPFADLLMIIKTTVEKTSRFHLLCYELSTRNAPNIDDTLNLSKPDDIFNSLRRGCAEMTKGIKTRTFQVASEKLGLEISTELKDYFLGLYGYDKIAKKLFQGGGYVYSLYETLKQLSFQEKSLKQWQTGQNQIEFHVVAFLDRGRHFLHVREEELPLLKAMGEVYSQGMKGTSNKSHDEEIRQTERSLLNKIRHQLTTLRQDLKKLWDRVRDMFDTRQLRTDYLDFSFTEQIEGYCPTASVPTEIQLQQWLPTELASYLQKQPLTSMQDAHAALLKYIWESPDHDDIYVLSGTPGIGKTTALRNILANYPHSYLLLYLSPRIQVNTDLMAKFDPTVEGNLLVGKDELICLNTNSNLIKNATLTHKKPAVIALSRRALPDDPKLLFLTPEDAEEIENQPLDNVKKWSLIRRIESSAVTDAPKIPPAGVFNTLVQAIHRLTHHYGYRRIVACVATQANRQVSQDQTTVRKHLKKLFGEIDKLDTASIAKFAGHIQELVFFIDEVTGDGAGRQTVQELIDFRNEVLGSFKQQGQPCPLKFRIIIADASLINAASVHSYLNDKQSQPDQILFTGQADKKGLSLEDTLISGLRAKVINANVYPARTLTLRWQPVLGFCDNPEMKTKAYNDLEGTLLHKLAKELIIRWQQRPMEQVIVIIQNKRLTGELENHLHAILKGDPGEENLEQGPNIICLHANSPPDTKRRIVSPATAEQQNSKPRIVGITTQGDLADIIIMTSSGTRGISFPNATKIICFIPTFSLENNFMEFLQGIYRGRGSGKGNDLDREIHLIIPQILVAPPELTTGMQASQSRELSATVMLMRMSILTRIFGATELSGQPVACIPLAGTLVEGASQTTMDEIENAIRQLEREHHCNPNDTNLYYIVEQVRPLFQHETALLHHKTGRAHTLASAEYQQRLRQQFEQDANKGFDVIAQGDYLPPACYTVGELLLQRLDALGIDLAEKNKYSIETHLEVVRDQIQALCVKLKLLAEDKELTSGLREAAKTLYGYFTVLGGEAWDSDTESETRGAVLNRWLVFPLNALATDNFWENQVEPDRFKAEFKTMLQAYFNAYLCTPNYTLPIADRYADQSLPWLLVRGPEIEQRLNAQYQTRYLVSSRSLSLLNIMLLAEARSGPFQEKKE